MIPIRIASNREFFNISPEKAYEILCDIADLLDDGEVSLFGDNIEVKSAKESGEIRRKGQLFDFYKKNIRNGEVICFVEDEKITAVVTGARQVLFEDEIWYLSPLVKELYARLNKVNKSGAYQGPLYFSYKGKKLTDIPNVTE